MLGPEGAMRCCRWQDHASAQGHTPVLSRTEATGVSQVEVGGEIKLWEQSTLMTNCLYGTDVRGSTLLLEACNTVITAGASGI